MDRLRPGRRSGGRWRGRRRLCRLHAPTKAPSRGPITANVLAGEQLFARVGCAICHTPSITTAPPGTVINGGAMSVPMALGNKIIHPYSDFLLHDIGTGDGIPVPADAGICVTAPQIDRAAVGAADAQPADA